jgi:hypothetical protein
MAGGLAVALLVLWPLATGDAAFAARTGSDPEALKLLGDVAGAARSTAYEGTQVTTSWNGGRAATARTNVSHTVRAATFLRGSAVDRDTPSRGPGAAEPRGGLVGVSSTMLDLLTRTYSVVRAKDGSICGRPAHVVEARRADGSAAGRFWIDRDTGLMLYREVLDPGGRAANVTGFNVLRVISTGGRDVRAPEPAGAPPGRVLATAELSDLREHGWTLPKGLPGNLTLHEARQSGGVVHLSYSDGLSAVSIFVQPGELDQQRFARWSRRSRDGRTVFEYDAVHRWAVWTSRGYVYTVLADSPQDTSDAVVAALPHGAPGFWERLRRGFARLNPFG